MSTARRTRSSAKPRTHAQIFAALGEEHRLAIVMRLHDGQPRSISQLTAGSRLTRQAVTKHLHVLQKAGIVCSARAGRESLFRLDARPLEEARSYLKAIADQWDAALERLRLLVEE